MLPGYCIGQHMDRFSVPWHVSDISHALVMEVQWCCSDMEGQWWGSNVSLVCMSEVKELSSQKCTEEEQTRKWQQHILQTNNCFWSFLTFKKMPFPPLECGATSILASGLPEFLPLQKFCFLNLQLAGFCALFWLQFKFKTPFHHRSTSLAAL
jgi:hypothetical protein